MDEYRRYLVDVSHACAAAQSRAIEEGQVEMANQYEAALKAYVNAINVFDEVRKIEEKQRIEASTQELNEQLRTVSVSYVS